MMWVGNSFFTVKIFFETKKLIIFFIWISFLLGCQSQDCFYIFASGESMSIAIVVVVAWGKSVTTIESHFIQSYHCSFNQLKCIYQLWVFVCIKCPYPNNSNGKKPI